MKTISSLVLFKYSENMLIENSPINVEFIMLFCACMYLTHILALDGPFFHIYYFSSWWYFSCMLWIPHFLVLHGLKHMLFSNVLIWNTFGTTLWTIYLFGSKMEMNFTTLILLEVKMIQSLVNLLYKYTLVQVVMFIQVWTWLW